MRKSNCQCTGGRRKRMEIGNGISETTVYSGGAWGVWKITAPIISRDYSVIMERGMKNGNSIPWNLTLLWKGWREQYGVLPNVVWHLEHNQYVPDFRGELGVMAGWRLLPPQLLLPTGSECRRRRLHGGGLLTSHGESLIAAVCRSLTYDRAHPTFLLIRRFVIPRMAG